MPAPSQRVAVVGGGIQGCAVALELARRGMDVDLFDRRPRLFDGASRHSEGKIHLGFVYAADESLRTARLMAHGAAAFAPALRRWIGDGMERLVISTPFNYVVHRRSMRPPEELEAVYRRITAIVRDAFAGGPYFGGADPTRLRRLDPGEAAAYGPDAAAVFETGEIAIEPDVLADELVAAVHRHERIRTATDTTVLSADRAARRLSVVNGAGEQETEPFDHIVNCAWEGRLALDASAGLPQPDPWSFRMKYFGRVDRPDGADPPPSTTIVLGSFGDVVDFGDGRTYLSWYPVGRRGWSSDLSPPSWPTTVAEEDARDIITGIGEGLAGVVPAAGRLVADHPDHARVRGGVIYALGDTDISDARSVLHQRHRVGPSSHATYHTVDTGKLTLAPLFALDVADRIEAARA
jgi:glycine/D-amino acid oxidase-like deaminating enzyme